MKKNKGSIVKLLVSTIASILVLLPFSAAPAADSAAAKKAVLITGATTGIGRATAEHLAATGYFVYAGARKDADMAELNKIDNIMAVRIDVTRQEQIDAAVKLIEAQGRGLWGLVNNAGVNVVAPLIEAKESDFEFLFDINVYGVFRVTQAFAPMIMAANGRIVNISSISGVLSGDGYGMYSASKHALEAMTDALADELGDFGVRVSAVNPGNFASEIGLTRCKRLIEDKDGDDWGQFENRRQEMLDDCKQRLKAGVENEGTSPEAVALAVQKALFDENPRDRYLVVPRQVEAGWTIAAAVDEMLALNVGHEYSYSRDEIAQLIDALWPYASGLKSRDDPEDEAELTMFMEAWMEKQPLEVDQTD
jgi:NAD(P)-dependent dehydrogenase (short-subunit alcohol dehydrogenase family)